METKDTLSSCSNSEEQQMQQFKTKQKKVAWVKERHMQTTDEQVNTSKALDASLVDTKSSKTQSVEEDTSSRSGNDAHVDDTDIKPIYDEEPMAEGKESDCAKSHHMIEPGSSRWKPMVKIFKTVGLRWVPTGKIFTSSTTKVDSEPTNGSDEDITNQYEYEQTLNVSACTLNLSAVKMEILLEPTSNKLLVDVLVLRTSKYGESNASALEDLTL
nr:hypothetical protein [Tanacetum cinerariifolium]